MTILEAITEQLECMKKANPMTDDKVVASQVKEFGHLVVIGRHSQKGRRGVVYTVFETEAGLVGWWPLANMGPHLGWFTPGGKK